MIVSKIKRVAAMLLSLSIAANGIIASAQGNNGPPGNSPCSLVIPVSVLDQNGWIPDGTTFTVEMTGEDNAPLPETTSYDVNVSGEITFGPIYFEEPGDYEYTVSEITYDDENIVFDDTVYHVYVSVLWNDAEELVCCAALTRDGSDAKPEEIVFINDYEHPPDSSSAGTSGSQTGSDSGTESASDSAGSSSTSSTSATSGGTSSSADTSASITTDGLIPDTGTAVTLGFSGAVLIGLALMIIGKRRDENDDPPQEETG